MNCKRAVFSWTLAAVVSLPVPLAIPASAAQPISTPQRVTNQPPAYCRGSTLTGAEFMKLIHDIIAHGDLTDIAFAEKTFGTKFSSRHNEMPNGNPDPQSFIYETDNVLGNPIHIDLYVWNSKSDQDLTLEIAFIRIESSNYSSSNENFISDCLHIPAPEFASYFGNDFDIEFPTAGAPIANATPKYSSDRDKSAEIVPLQLDASQIQGSTGRGGSKIYLGFSYHPKDNLAYEVVIRQKP